MTRRSGPLRSVLPAFRVCATALLLGAGLLTLPQPVLAQGLVGGAGAIEAIRVEGTTRIDASTVLSYMTVRPGDPFDPVKIDESVKALFATGLFADVRIERRGGDLVVLVAENPSINRVAFEGNDLIKDETLEAEVTIQPRRTFTAGAVQRDTERLLEVYRRSGRFGAVVEPKIIRLDQNRVDVVFEISEGPETKVTSISFVGNEAFPDSTLRNVVRTQEAAWYRFLTTDDTYDPDRISFDEEQLRRFYLANGYADFRVLSSVAELSPEGDEFFVTFSIEEGPQYTLGTVEVRSEIEGVDAATLTPLLEVESGDIYDATAIDSSRDEIVRSLNQQGVSFVTTELDARRNPETQILDLTVLVKPGPRQFLERINISGNTRTLDEVIRRELPLAEGDPLNPEKLAEGERAIRDLDFFSKVDVQVENGSEADQQVININVEEQSTGELTIGGGYSSGDGPGAEFAIREKNFLGRGQDVRIAASLSGRRREVDFSFTEPFFLRRDLSAGVDVFHRTTDYSDESSYNLRETGAGLRFGYPLSTYLRQTVGYRLQLSEIADVDDDASRLIREQEGERTLSQLSQALTYDRRDSALSPTRGYLLRLSNDLAGLGGTERFFRTRVRAEVYRPVPIGEDVVFSGLAEAGTVIGLGEDVAINERFNLGGNSLRGFQTNGIGPRDTDTDDALGGNTFYRGSAELAFPIGLPEELGIKGHAFADAGSLFGLDEDGGSDIQDEGSIRAAAGLGLSWRSPLGPLRVDFAVPFLKEEYDETQEFRFSFGTRF